MNGQAYELALTEEEIGAVLKFCGQEALLVGGQALAVSLTLPDGGIKQIDFLKSIAGLDTASIEARAVDLVLANGAHIRVLHPLDVLESRLRNLDLLPSKQNPVGRAQMKLAVGVMAKFLRVLLAEESVRVVLEAVERVADIAFDPRLSQVLLAEGIDLLGEVSAQEINSCPFASAAGRSCSRRKAVSRRKNAALVKHRAKLLEHFLNAPPLAPGVDGASR